ncbi:uncharacterized protein EV154DRAFT_530699 [Mucor mucedo]|uniref:uncharacterized protein n=1 Tax=Mucor mucedo TaxID=29922 RepID=UPI00221E4F7B|nr:uncharacterized protein EV154DRAFT_530699 [Mucor mucedo]KAI7869603.1 hypothetical protein EV154DRAFT_530699 [Mucor mucedo]
MKSRIVLLFLVLVSCLLATEAKKTQSWKFMNFNKYKKLTIGKGSVMDKSWGIQEHSGWLWFWKGADKLKNAAAIDPSKKTKDLVLRVKYPANSVNPESNTIGGLGFLAQPLTINKSAKVVSLQYSVFFPKGFDFVRGGKLPGLYGGHGECTGGSSSSACFTTRLMWRGDGFGEVYAYLPHSLQRKDLCDDKVNICNPDYGFSLGRNKFQFKTGKWTSVRQVLTLNTAGKKNGKLNVYVNGKLVIQEKNLVFRTSSSGRVVGIMFHTFFGGSDSTWKSPKSQYSYFKNFYLKTST